MSKIKLALVGCGGMGTRHLYGMRELLASPFNNIEPVGVCDIRLENAELAASEAETLFGYKPAVFTDMEAMAVAIPDLDAVSVVTDPSVHHTVVCRALELGWHVMVEKPMAITVGACRMMIDTAARHSRILSVAENYRRDPSARLIRHILEKEWIGKPYLAWCHALGGGNTIFITPWRHIKDKGGPILDMGVHYTDLIRYQLGDIAEVYGDARLLEKLRYKPESIGDQYAFYQNRHRAMEESVPATAEDVSVALFRMESGIMVNWIMGRGGTGGIGGEMILCEEGKIASYGTRGGRAEIQRKGKDKEGHEALVEMASDFELEPLAAHFFPDCIGAENVDWRLIALEYFELGEAILHGRQVELDGLEGLKDVAAVYAILESSLAGRSVSMQEIEACQVYGYQQEIDEAFGIPG
jgi:predicted dehydrogenase